MSNFIFITGGVVSSLGKGITAASIGSILKHSGFKINIKKLDPYLNIDPGTMSPSQHGEVFITKDGGETDLDLGYYERIAEIECSKNNNITTGRLYEQLLKDERAGKYLGQTVQIIPHVTDLIKNYILQDSDNFDFNIIELGGTVGDMEIQPFLEAIRQLRHNLGQQRTIFIHLTLVPYLKHSQEIKTKPTQHSFKELMKSGIVADVIVCRTEVSMPQKEKEKTAILCGLSPDAIFEAVDVESVYLLQEKLYEQGIHNLIYKHTKTHGDSNLYKNFLQNLKSKIEIQYNSKHVVKLAIVGKYTDSEDCYKSLIEAIKHAGIANHTKVEIDWVNAREDFDLEKKDISAILVPGGFGTDGIEGKLKAIEYARKNDIPFLGICYGMQLAVIEYARNVVGIKNANTTEIDPSCEKLICLMNEWVNEDRVEIRNENSDIGGTMRLGEYEVELLKNSKIAKIYESEFVKERHRHRYVVNKGYVDLIEKHGAKFSGVGLFDGMPEVFEIENKRFFVGVQFHPEFNSLVQKPSLLFVDFIKSAIIS
jgi:CTP synthase